MKKKGIRKGRVGTSEWVVRETRVWPVGASEDFKGWSDQVVEDWIGGIENKERSTFGPFLVGLSTDKDCVFQTLSFSFKLL